MKIQSLRQVTKLPHFSMIIVNKQRLTKNVDISLNIEDITKNPYDLLRLLGSTIHIHELRQVIRACSVKIQCLVSSDICISATNQ